MSPIIRTLIEEHTVTFERYVIVGLINSYKFYRQYRDIICPWQPDRLSVRRDFATPQYNFLYQAIATFWELQEDPGDGDWRIEKELLKDYTIDTCNTGGVDEKTARALIEEIDNDLYREFSQSVFTSVLNPEAVSHWVNIRIGRQLINQLHNQSQVGFIRADQIKTLVAQMTTGLTLSQQVAAKPALDIALGFSKYSARIPCSIPGLNNLLGGGFGRREATMIAGINGGGKTVLACQLAFDFARFGAKVMLFTTEQKPYQLIQRILANAASIPISEFINRRDFDPSDLTEREVANVPEYLWTDPLYSEKMQIAAEVLRTGIYCVDWAEGQGFTIANHFENEVEAVEMLGWNPDVVIFDWIGGGLEKMKDHDKLRHLYQESADFLVDHAKKTNRAVITMAQLDKTKATNKPTIRMDWLSECKTMTNNFTNFIGISSMLEQAGEHGSNRNFAQRQYLSCGKSRFGAGGCVPVDAMFKFQRFTSVRPGLVGGG